MRHRALRCLRRLVPGLPEHAVRSDGLSVATRYPIDRTETMHPRRLLLAALIIPTFTLSAQHGSAAPNGATIAAATRTARLDHARAQAASRPASIDSLRFGITPPEPSGDTSLERLRPGAFPGVGGSEAESAEEVSLLAGPFQPYRTRAGSVWIVHAESGGNPAHAGAQRMHLTTTHERPLLLTRAS